MEGQEGMEGADAALLEDLTEERLLGVLRERYAHHRVYTYIGDILIAVNPLQDLPIYGAQVSDSYSSQPIRSLPPHVFAVADRAYRELQAKSPAACRNQTIVISGDSGAGKTESTKLLLRHLVRCSRGNSQLCQQILQVNPLLEAFGNAQTVMNQNSSRFGKYIQLRFSHGAVKGAKINEYLLEKSRVSHQDPGERNFHVFYSMLYGCPGEEREVYGLLTPSMYRYIAHGCCEESRDWAEEYKTLCNAMRMVGFQSQEELDLKTILSGILSLGNIVFAEQEEGGVIVSGEACGWLKAASGQFGVQEEDLHNSLVCTISVTRRESIRRLHNKQQAEDSRDSIARVVYARMFGWIVTKVNQLLASDVEAGALVQEIGILDIFGFENFEINRFEQLCINLANEQLQNFFNHHIFLMEQQHYQEEDIQHDTITFTNNQPILDLFLDRPCGLLSILDEQTSFPQASDASFVEKLNTACKTHPHFERARGRDPGFIINHYAGKVQYTALGFLEKNRDTIPTNIQNLFINSVTNLLSLLFAASISRTGTLMPAHRSKAQILQETSASRKMSVGAQFRRSLSVLMEKMYSASPHFIRCIKPNNDKLPEVFRPEEVLKQLRYNGLMETMRIRRDGFSWRPSFHEFVDRFGIVLLTPQVPVSRDSCLTILQRAQLSGWQCGKLRLFFKYWHQEELTQHLLLLHQRATKIQTWYKGLRCRQAYRKLVEEMRVLQEKLKMEELERERLRLERLERERLRREELERERLRREELERERLRLEELEKERLRLEGMETERLRLERLERERLRLEELEKEHLRQEGLERERLRLEELEKEHLRQKELERERLRLEELENEHLRQEGLERERLRLEGLERERLRLEKERSRLTELEARKSAAHPVPLPRRRPPVVQIMTESVPSQMPVPRPRSQLFPLSPFDNAIRRVPSLKSEEQDQRQMQRRKTLIWFRETQATKVLHGGEFPPWLFGMISRRDAENLLRNREVGDFLFRINQTKAGYILSYRGADRCRHFMVDVHSNGCYVILGEDRAHASLSALVEYHSTIGIQPLGETLRKPCEKAGDWEPDCEELKFLTRTLSLGEENVPSDNQSQYRKPDEPCRLLPQFHKSIRRAMHEIQQASSVHIGLDVEDTWT
ncbi:myosin-IIIb-like [Hyperolius riggenbachi]|uniref:myosin-IIIb-like n=1 Tax=Hyperolius riggenbachi TaxID=752182 RepID=UPI0035A31FEA